MTTNLRTAAVTLAILSVSSSAFSQRPSDPALLVPQNAPLLEYVAVPDPLPVPAGTTMGAPSSVAFDAKGHLFVATRGTHAFFEFDPNGKFVRAFGEGLLTRSHGLHIDREGNIWVTDVGAHVVLKLNQQGQVLLTLGVKGEAGEWNEASQSRRLNQPNDVVDRAQWRHLRHAGAHAGGDGRSTGAQIRQKRKAHHVVGRQREGAG